MQPVQLKLAQNLRTRPRYASWCIHIFHAYQPAPTLLTRVQKTRQSGD
jgi:hypothetical protein